MSLLVLDSICVSKIACIRGVVARLSAPESAQEARRAAVRVRGCNSLAVLEVMILMRRNNDTCGLRVVICVNLSLGALQRPAVLGRPCHCIVVLEIKTFLCQENIACVMKIVICVAFRFIHAEQAAAVSPDCCGSAGV